LEPIEIAISIGGGFVAGVINTLAGSGSVITLAILTELLGLPGGIANGSNRIGIALQTVSSSVTFQKARILSWKEQSRPTVLMIIGAVLGVGLAGRLDPAVFFQSHRSCIVRLDRIRVIEPAGARTFRLLLDHPDEPRVPLARDRATRLREKIPFSR